MYLTNNWTIFYLNNLEVQLSKYVVSFIWGELRFWMVPYHLTFFGVFLRFEHFFSLVSCGAVSYTKISNQWHRRGLWCICAPTSPGLLNNYLCMYLDHNSMYVEGPEARPWFFIHTYIIHIWFKSSSWLFLLPCKTLCKFEFLFSCPISLAIKLGIHRLFWEAPRLKLKQMVKNWILDRSTARNYTVVALQNELEIS